MPNKIFRNNILYFYVELFKTNEICKYFIYSLHTSFNDKSYVAQNDCDRDVVRRFSYFSDKICLLLYNLLNNPGS